MALTYTWIHLGHSPLVLDPTEGNDSAEGAASFVNQTYGSPGSPLFSKVVQATAMDQGGPSHDLDTDNAVAHDQILTNIGAGPQLLTFDGVGQFTATVTYVDGTTAVVSAVIVQTTTGQLFLAPELTNDPDTAAYEAKPIQSLQLTALENATHVSYGADRYVTGFDDGAVDGTSGNDLINASYAEPIASGSDRIDHGDGTNAASLNDDLVRAKAGDDTVLAGVGNDTVYGGTGNDSLSGEAGHDLLHGDEGNDGLSGGIGNDTLHGGDGNDSLDGGTDNDQLFGDAGADTLHGGAGDDRLEGGDGNDSLNGDAGNDTLLGQAGADSLFGGIGNDQIFGGADADQLWGGDGADTLDGGDGNDILYGGNDTLGDLLIGGGGRDTVFGNFGDTVDGSGTGDDFDVLDLRDWGKSRTHVIKDPLNPENGIVEFLDENGNVIGTMSFTDIETVIPCFTPGTLIATDQGLRAVETLAEGDLVMTRDGGLRPVVWTGRRTLSPGALRLHPALRPVRIAAGALGPDTPARDMLVSPQHRMLMVGHRAEMLFGEFEVLVAAIHLVGQPGITQPLVRGVEYVHLMFDRHEIILSDGAWSESFQPAARMIGAMDQAVAKELRFLFPALAETGLAFPAARLSLKAHEARVLLAP